MLEVMAAEDSPLSELVRDFIEFPQTLLNVRVAKKVEFSQFPEIAQTIIKIEDSLGESGRLNVRYSGTEPVARIMIEGDDSDTINDYARQIADAIRKYLGE